MQELRFFGLLPKITSLRRLLHFEIFKKVSIFCFIAIFTLLSPQILGSVFAQTTDTKVLLSSSIGIVGGYTMPVNVSVYNITNSAGLAAFSFKIGYNPNLLSIPDSNNDYIADTGVVSVGPFLGSSGKQVSCGDGYIDIDLGDSTTKYLTFTCGTLGATPAAPLGSGVLATVNFKTGNTVSVVPLTLAVAQLADNTASASLISNTAVSGSGMVAKCADVAGNDGVVTIADIIYVLNKYHTNDSAADLDNSGLVLINDVLIAIGEFNKTC